MPLADVHVLLVHAGIAHPRLLPKGRGDRKFGRLLPHLDVPDGGHVAVLLGVGDGDAQVAGLCFALVNHRRALHGVAGAIGIELPLFTVGRGLNLILIEEGGILELRPYLIELHRLAEVYLQPFARSHFTCLPQRGVVVVHSIFRLEPLVVVGRGSNLGAVGKVLVLRGILEDGYVLCIVRRHNGHDIALGIELQLVDAHLAVEAVNGAGQVVAVVDDVVATVVLQHRVVTRAVNSLVLVGGQQLALVLERSHRSYLRHGILHTVGIGMAGAAGVGEVVDAVTLEDKRSLEDVLQLGIGNEPFLGEERVGSDGERMILVPVAGGPK